ncbi:PqqD family protein [Sphingobacterium sp. UT-1RO-CII-1]|uniref:PqqD family protein n=1 Tax=Sphingobacterium sp. UT-1RO-CII-1 TaxID=2995225 RepID=UPI00227AE274|nr:PqqD family protein [Sphingobacterium sp. UT-1RO-CII-1]MCY4778528.1 PqqD family protein [Sphingobacterium sp. UT-1RO-CII-1]
MKLRKDLILRTIGDYHVVVDPGQEMVDMSTVFTLNSTSAFLWQELENSSFTVEAIAELLCQHYEVTEETARKDAETIFIAFREHGLLVD